MITVSVRRSGDIISGFTVEGHAGYADKGEDIVCAAVSILAINTVNSIEKLTGNVPVVDESDGFLDVKVPDPTEKGAKLLLDSFLLGIEGIVEEYGNKFVKLSLTDA